MLSSYLTSRLNPGHAVRRDRCAARSAVARGAFPTAGSAAGGRCVWGVSPSTVAGASRFPRSHERKEAQASRRRSKVPWPHRKRGRLCHPSRTWPPRKAWPPWICRSRTWPQPDRPARGLARSRTVDSRGGSMREARRDQAVDCRLHHRPGTMHCRRWRSDGDPEDDLLGRHPGPEGPGDGWRHLLEASRRWSLA